MGAGSAFAQPTGGQVIQGHAILQQQGNSLLVTTQNAAGTNRSVINWQSFSVPAGSTTQFLQPSAQSLSINRVVGNDPSAIYGTLSSNGRLVLVNPAGIAVGAGAVVDTAGFTASTLKMSDADALAGRLRFANDGTAGALAVNGSVISRGGDVVLIAPNVQVGSQAVIQSQGGAAILAAGQKVEVTGRGLEGIVMEVQAPTDSAVNLGTLQGDAVGIFAGTLRHSGLVQANAVTTEGGKVVLRASGDNLVDGRIEAKAGDHGGTVDVFGKNVALYGGGSIDASGANGGGTVRFGGDFHGSNPDVPNASATFVGAGSTINADATQSGDGGRVVVWSDNATRFHGHASARGGAAGGNGGFAEVSGKKYLEYAGTTDLRAPHGAAGQLLLDPNDIVIDNNLTSADALAPDFSGGAVTSTVNTADLAAQLLISNVNITTTTGSNGPLGGTITVNKPIAWDGGAGLTNELTLHADQDIFLNAPITSPNGMLGMWAGNSITQSSAAPITVATLGAGAGNSVLLNGSPNQIGIFAATGGSGSGALSLTNAGPLTISWYDSLFYADGVSWNGPATITTTGLLTVNSTVTTSGGGLSSPLSLNSSGGVLLNASVGTDGGPVTVKASAGDIDLGTSQVYSNGGAISIGAAAGSILGSGLVQSTNYSTGGDSGPVTLTSSDAVSVNNIDASGYSMGANGGNVSISAGAGGVNLSNIYSYGADNDVGSIGGKGGNVTITSAGPVSINGTLALAVVQSLASVNGGIDTSGGVGLLGSGGDAGDVTITAKGPSSNIYVATEVRAEGGGGSAGSGGNGGTVTLTATNGVAVSSIDTSGGWGTLGAGGNAGPVSLDAGAGALSVQSLYTSGGDSDSSNAGNGGDVTGTTTGQIEFDNVQTYGGTSTSNGNGGNGGNVTLTGGTWLASPYAATDGGGGGDNALGTTGSGGNAGNISVTQTAGDFILTPSLSAYGGNPGATGLSAGSGGSGGNITLSAANGTLTLDSGSLSAGSNVGTPGTITASGSGGVTVAGAVTYDGNWVNTGAMNIATSVGIQGGLLSGYALFTNKGTLQMTDGSYLYAPNGVVNNSGAMLGASGGATTIDLTQNHGTLVVAGDATLAANLFTVNDGTIALSGTLMISPPIQVAGASTLLNDTAGVIAGNGTLDLGGPGVGLLDNRGRLQPGAATDPHAIGTLTVNGDVLLEPGSVLAEDIASASSYDRLHVTGSTSASALRAARQFSGQLVPTTPIVEVTYAPGVSFASGTLFSVIQSDGGVVPGLMPTVAGVTELAVQAVTQGATALNLVALSPLPVPTPAPPTSGLVQKLGDYLGGDYATAEQVLAQLDSNPLTTFTQLFFAEAQKQDDGEPGTDNIVANTCTK